MASTGGEHETRGYGVSMINSRRIGNISTLPFTRFSLGKSTSFSPTKLLQCLAGAVIS
eukprot:SAG31_NODE_2511_length_5585_cov_2.160408_2_plen_58_part_00